MAFEALAHFNEVEVRKVTHEFLLLLASALELLAMDLIDEWGQKMMGTLSMHEYTSAESIVDINY